MSPTDVPAALTPIDLGPYLSESSTDSCAALAASLRTFGAALVVDARLSPSTAARFRNLLERYFAQPEAARLADARPDIFYQVGATPSGVEVARRNDGFTRALRGDDRAVSQRFVEQRGKDPKWRFFWRVGDRPAEGKTKFPGLNAPQVVPEKFEGEWEETMDGFGMGMMNTVETAAEMLAIGLGLGRREIADKMILGPHLLAPTGTDMTSENVGVEGATMAGVHYDLNVITAHAAASFPGLFIWTAEGKRLRVVVPPNTLLLQAGSQLEHLTAGEIKRGFHEVVVSTATLAGVEKAREKGNSLWRISSTFFAHCASDTSISPLGHFVESEEAKSYDILAGDQVAAELKAIALTDDAAQA